MKRLIYIACAALLALASCSDQGKQFEVKAEFKNPLYHGDTLAFSITSERNKLPDSVTVQIDGKDYRFGSASSLRIATEGFAMGDKSARFTIYRGKHKEVHLRTVRLLSDVVPVRLGYEVVATFPHDAKAYTQGLQLQPNGKVFWESTGLYGESTLRKVDVKSGAVLQNERLDDRYFGEGLTVAGDRLYQLTWREQTCFVYEASSLDHIGQHPLATEGWGMCFDGTSLIVSDGSEFLYFYDTANFALQRKVAVFNNLGAVSLINELEFVDGFVFANIYQSDEIVKINPRNGKVIASIDFSDLLAPQYQANADVLNGIAWNPATDHFYVTGKLWPKLFEVRLFYKE